MAALVDTNILVYRYDARFPDKQRTATSLLRKGLEEDSIRLSHQTLVEFVAATTRSVRRGEAPLLTEHEAQLELEDLLLQFPVVYPDEELLRLAIRGAATYRLSWFDAHMWAYAEYYDLDTLWSEDFSHQRIYGRVKVINPFVKLR